MKQYWVEGTYCAKSARNSKEAEPFYQSFWADSEQEALAAAQQALRGGRWLTPPRVSTLSEEQRMRRSGAPELPGLN